MSGIVLGTKGKQFDENLPLSLYFNGRDIQTMGH